MTTIDFPVLANWNGDEEIAESRDLNEIESRGYRILKRIGSGKTRDVYRAERIIGHVRQEVVVKIPKKEIDLKSVQTRIAMSKGRDWNLREAEVSNKLWNPRVAKLVDSFTTRTGKTVNVEPYYEGSRDLETEIRLNNGPVSRQRVKQILEDLIEGVCYMHGQGLIHKDLKPSNVLITKDGRAVITDMQTAGPSEFWTYLPTRGGTPFTEPCLINSLLENLPGTISAKNDIYAIGGIAYCMLTGEEVPFKYKLEESSQGSPVKIGDETIKVVLKDEKESLRSITLKQHAARLKKLDKKMYEKGVSRGYRDFVLRCLSIEDKFLQRSGPISDDEDLRKALRGLEEKVIDKLGKRLVEELPRTLRRSAIAAAAGLGIAAGLTGLYSSSCAGGQGIFYSERMLTKTPSLFNRHSHNFSIGDMPFEQRLKVFEILSPYLDNAEANIGMMGEDKGGASLLDFAENVHGLNRRVASALLKTISIYGTASREQYIKEEGERRAFPGCVPIKFAEEFYSELGSRRAAKIDEEESVISGIVYMRQCFSPDKDVADVFAVYFASEQQVREAILKSGSIDYFPNYDVNGNLLNQGYGSALPEFKQKLIGTAVGLYHLTDETGRNIDFSRLKFVRERVRATPLVSDKSPNK